MKKIYRKAFGSPMVHRLLYGLVRGYSATFRFSFENELPLLAHLKAGSRVLICVWHQQFFALIAPFKRYAGLHPALMISKSADGELIAGVARHIGWHTVRGSSSEGGRTALKEMIRHLKKHRLAGHVVDGPKGPMGQVKPGAIQLALMTGAAIVPVYVSADRAWFFNSWDRFFIPKPFSRVIIRFDSPIRLSRPKTEDEFEALRQRIEKIMEKELRIAPAKQPL
ncbi:MAG: lysophospholipid acyltransferase family protein [Desulfobacterales bacterium]|nr:lysophospholipid acyltransferase family protein [Desulfobacterales bacterium]